MSNEIDGIKSLLPGKVPALGIKSLSDAQGTEKFSDLLSKAVGSVNDLSLERDRLALDLAMGRPVELHQVMLAASKAQIAMELFIELRNKLIEAYQEISRMPI
ncbi:MAG TPA: flagellar hook-basal body complex protein FliE [Firmicutes bacterium]|nr:flagellar hook-basal body complex protein FliE [Bacillota bacterium]